MHNPNSPPGGTTSRSDLYGEGYFHGQNSGYSEEGYRRCHPDWSAWLEFIRSLKPAGTLIDVGCAYGYLVNEARQRGYRAFGLDVSSFALRQEPDVRSRLVNASAARLPFRSRSADIITLFDVLEHLDNPYDCLAEIRRVLTDDGLLLGATPDPIFFNRAEATHVSERPPSFWLATLRRLGFDVRFRFSGEAYNFQFAATPSRAPLASNLNAYQHDYFDPRMADVVRVQERASGQVDAVLRSGWGSVEAAGRKLVAFPASLYLLNRGDQPLALHVAISLKHTPAFSTLRLRLNSYVVNETNLDSEEVERTIELDELLLPSGGHHLFFDLFPGGPEVTIQSISIEARSADRKTLVAALPFDLFQRYRLASDIARILRPERILDIGGYLGDENGHLAVAHDFLQQEPGSQAAIIVTDLRQCDHPDYFKAPAAEQPFADSSFDLVMSLDVLEHLPQGEREPFLQELDRLSRRWIILGAPFASTQVEQAEEALAESVMQARRFLNEHRELGLPQEAFARDYFLSKDYAVTSFPNGYLPSWLYWQATTQYYFALNNYDLIRSYNALYAALFYSRDNREPAYRHILLVSKSPLGPAEEELSNLASAATAGRHPCDSLGSQPDFLGMHQRMLELVETRQRSLTNVQFLINERQKLIGFMEGEIAELKRLEARPLWRKAWDRFREKIK